jgi:hypothetical protein
MASVMTKIAYQEPQKHERKWIFNRKERKERIDFKSGSF